MIEVDAGLAGLLGALIGAGVLCYIARKTADKVQDNFKAEKLAEAKRDIFLTLVDNWMNYLLVVNSFKICKQNDYMQAIFQATKDLVSSLHKSSFISKSKTKKAVMLFTFNFSKKNLELSGIINSWYYSEEQDLRNLEYNLFQILEGLGYEALDLQNLLRTELGIANDPQVDSFLLEKQKEFVCEMKRALFNEE